MKTFIMHLLLALLWMPLLRAGVPKMEDLKSDEQISVSVMHSEPAVSECTYVFVSRSVTISENGKTLGKLVISAEDALRIDQYLSTIERGKKAGRNVLGAPVYTISHQKSGKTTGTWTFRIDEPKETTKPVLSLAELKKRLP